MVDMEAAMLRSLFRPKIVTFEGFFNCLNCRSFLGICKSPEIRGPDFSLKIGSLAEFFYFSRNCTNRNIKTGRNIPIILSIYRSTKNESSNVRCQFLILQVICR